MMRVKIEDVCMKGSSNLKQSDVVGKNGIYPVYGAAGYLGSIDSFKQSKPYVAVVKDGAGIGRAMLLPSNSSIIGTMQYLLPKDNILPEYLYYLIKAKHLEKYYSGATILQNYRNQIDLLDELVKARFVELFGDVRSNNNYPNVLFSECVEHSLRGPFGSDMKKSLYVPKNENTIKVYIQINAIQKNENLGDYYISKEYYDDKMYSIS